MPSECAAYRSALALTAVVPATTAAVSGYPLVRATRRGILPCADAIVDILPQNASGVSVATIGGSAIDSLFS